MNERVWTRQHPAIEIDHDADAISDDGRELYSLYRRRGIENVIIMGVHTCWEALAKDSRELSESQNARPTSLWRRPEAISWSSWVDTTLAWAYNLMLLGEITNGDNVGYSQPRWS